MAGEIKALFRELRWEVFKIIVLDSILDTTIFFFLAHLVFSFFKLSIYFGLVVAAVAFVGDIYYRMKTVKLKDVEMKNPAVREILRTANDNADDQNFVALALFEDLIQRMKNVSSGTMVKHGHVLTKMSVIFLLGFVMIIMSANSITIDVVDLPGFESRYSQTRRAAREIFGIEFNESTDIYGDSSIAKLGTEEVTLQLNPLMNEINLAKVRDVEERSFEEARWPSEIKAVSESPSDEKAPEEAGIAIAYNMKLKEGS